MRYRQEVRFKVGSWCLMSRRKVRTRQEERQPSSLEHATHLDGNKNKSARCRRNEASPHTPTRLWEANPDSSSHVQAFTVVTLQSLVSPSIESARPLRIPSVPPPTMQQRPHAHVLGVATQGDRARQDLVLVSRLWAPRTRRSSAPSANPVEFLPFWACPS
jgi:hypothetical protein